MSEETNLFEKFWSSLSVENKHGFSDQSSKLQMESMFYEGVKFSVAILHREAFNVKAEAEILNASVKINIKTTLAGITGANAESVAKLRKFKDQLQEESTLEGLKLTSQMESIVQLSNKILDLLVKVTPSHRGIPTTAYILTDPNILTNFVKNLTK